MAYYTDYTLEQGFTEETIQDIVKEVRASAYGNYWVRGNYNRVESAVLELSHRYPTITFVYSGYGEDTGDWWRMWVRNGQFKKEQAVLPSAEPDTHWEQ